MALQTVPLKESIKVLDECKELQLKKSQDYQNPKSTVKQAMHYRRGVDSIYDTMWGKMLRIRSILESGSDTNFESLEDSFKDLINYSSFAVEYLRGKMPGQDPDRDIFNKPKQAVCANTVITKLNYTESPIYHTLEQNLDEAIKKAKIGYTGPVEDVDYLPKSTKFNPYG